MFITSNKTEENSKISLQRRLSSNLEELKGDWESLGDELFFRKNKFEFTEKEKNSIKRMLSKSPPQLQHRRRVILYINNFYILVMDN